MDVWRVPKGPRLLLQPCFALVQEPGMLSEARRVFYKAVPSVGWHGHLGWLVLPLCQGPCGSVQSLL